MILFNKFIVILLFLSSHSFILIAKEPQKILIKAEQASNNLSTAIFTKKDIDVKKEGRVETFEKYYISWGKELRFQNLKYRIEDSLGTIVTYDGSIWKLKDSKSKKMLFTDSLDDVAFLSNELLFYVQTFLKDPNFSGDLIKGIDFNYLGDSIIDEVECEVVSYTIPKPKFFQDGDLKKKYFIGINDGLIRKIEFQIYRDTSLVETVESFFNFSLINKEISSDIFIQSLPDGFTEEKYILNSSEEDLSLKVGDEAPNWTLLDSYGKKHSLADYRGKIVILDFWATWCKWCIKAIPKLQSIHQNYNDFVEVLGISCSEKKEANPSKFLNDNGGSYTVLLNGETIVEDYAISGYPTTYIIGKDGRILWSYTGFDPKLDEQIIEVINKNK